MRRFRHGYTNATVGDGRTVVKRYAGPRAALRAEREYASLTTLVGRVPVPEVLERSASTLTLAFVDGVQGQELIDAGEGAQVLAACGAVLREIHAAGCTHGDFGPQNTLLASDAGQVVAVLDWEFATLDRADPVIDLAWCEWIVRMHHPRDTAAIPALHDAYGAPAPPWRERRAAMVGRCEELIAFSHEWDPDGPAEVLWRERLEVTSAWES
jgi:tRNA A-37 threonylcarbamoyl transferase component Bud32